MTRHRPLHDGKRLGQRGHAFGGESRILEAADVDRAQLSRRRRSQIFVGIASHLHQVAVMHDENLPVGGFLHIELDEVGVLLGRKTKCGQRILRRDRRRAAMRDDQRRGLIAIAQECEQTDADGGEQRDRSISRHRARRKSSWAA